MTEKSAATVQSWLADIAKRRRMSTAIVPLAGLSGWQHDPETDDIRHRSGKFFTVHGLRVDRPNGPVPHWDQPIIHQPEVGILGILAKRIDGVPHLLLQAKAEPGNHNGLQLSPTVQATRSNYTRVHGGRAVPYLEYFQDTSGSKLVTDVRQSEQGAWFFRKRNRNMVVETTDDVTAIDGFRWLPLGAVCRMLAVDDMVNMDTRTVLSCLPFREPAAGSRHHMDDILEWITDIRTSTELGTERIGLRDLTDWHVDDAGIRHSTGAFFDVIGVQVKTSAREVDQWCQPMFRPHGMGLVAFLVNRIDGVLHVLAHARTEPGCVDVAELAPTVQCAPSNLPHLPKAARPPFLDQVLGASRHQVLFGAIQSEEGGRFYHARTRYLIVQTDLGVRVEDEYPDYRWIAPHQLTDLLRHSHYVNVQARSLLACLRSLHTPTY
ncbi:NDP-hexose 2,3-dehydratase family protein [Nocardia transvalensis]|uniref:NDP-hexose 2,3-dehydratase family protein n=1 Tax=Nocardia transvalensis TaxID=37333 RepID=UPI0018954F44|nr:NDP-hexose 2,3-dehydratase family protein [Nocardia transvalensis]MBF6329797.1 NDP-hexose 2,3-dehydratase family protein [Nocardia transvalensis]